MAQDLRSQEIKNPIDVAEYLFRRLQQVGVESIHGVPGDYNLVALDYIPKVGLKWVGNCNELNAGYAADGYARVKGISALVTTFGVGELSAVNAIAGAYSEYVPIVHIVGYPSTVSQKNGALLHHTLGNGDFTVFSRMSKEISCAVSMLNHQHEAAMLIDDAIRECYLKSRPVYISLPSDMVTKKVDGDRLNTPLDLEYPPNDQEAEDYVVDVVLKSLHAAKNPVILVDACAIRHRALKETHELVKKSGIPTFVAPMGKGAVDETLPNYGGVYAGDGSNAGVRERVESSDLVLSIGAIKSDFNTAGFTIRMSQLTTIDLHSYGCKVRYSEYPNVRMNGVLSKVTAKLGQLNIESGPKPNNDVPHAETTSSDDKIKHAWFWPKLGQWLKPSDILITETGTSNFGIWETRFPAGVKAISQVLWGSIGYATGSCQGAVLAARESNIKRTILFTGDGSFQLTAQEVSTMIRNKLSPIIFVICNKGYTIERLIHGWEDAYNDVQEWKYKDIPAVFGAPELTSGLCRRTRLALIISRGPSQDRPRSRYFIFSSSPPEIAMRSFVTATRSLARQPAYRNSFQKRTLPSIVSRGYANMGHSVPPLNDKSLLKNQTYVNGEWIDARSGKTFEVHDPATGKLIGTMPEMDRADTEAAIAAAAAAFPSFRKITGRERSRMLRKWYQLMVDNAEDLAKLITWENGKPMADAKGEVNYAASFYEWFAEEAPRIYGTTIPASIAGNRVFTIKEPVGVVGLITPWNFPAAMITRKIGPALAAGCTVVAKSPGETPFTAAALAELAHRAGIPKGVVNFVTALKNTPEVGETITSSKTIKKVSFTGSTGVGKLLMKQSSDTLKKLSFELGGNAPFIVFDDADLESAVTGAITSKFRSSGQTCVCANRIYVQSGIYDEFCTKFTEKVQSFKVGGGYEEGITHGPLIHDRAVSKVDAHVQDAVKNGAKILHGGQKLPDLGANFYQPTVLRDMTKDMQLAKDETFGPVAGLFSFKTEADVVKLANEADVGLAGYFFSRDIQRVYRVAEALEVGMVGVNTGLISDVASPFGGVKESGFGREGSHMGIDEYVVTKTITMGGNGQPLQGE